MIRSCYQISAEACRTRCRSPAAAREPSDRFETVIRWQRACGHPGLGSTRRFCAALKEPSPCYPHDRHEGGRCAVRDRKSESHSEIRARQPLHRFATRAMDPLCTAYPSLRAHEPNPAWRAAQRDLAGFCILRTAVFSAFESESAAKAGGRLNPAGTHRLQHLL